MWAQGGGEPLLSAWTGRKDSACPWGTPCPLYCPAEPAILSPSHHPVPPEQGRMAQKRVPVPKSEIKGGGRLMKQQAMHNRVHYSLMWPTKCHTAALAAKGCTVFLAITTVLCIPFSWGSAPSCRASSSFEVQAVV